jgi:asparagine synthase (glutamine-hydrolysing)
MCGIVGVVRAPGRPEPDAACIERAIVALRHRGPDGSGMHVTPNVALGHTRLSIIDLAGGIQPMANEDRSVWTIYNGEIWNFADLRAELVAMGHTFVTRCDTEVLVHGYEEWGDDLVPRLNGMFAFAIWDERHKRVLLARDRIGKKPLYFAQTRNGLAFGSDARSLLLASGASPSLNEDALAEFLFQLYVCAPRTLFKGVERLPAGHLLTYESGSATMRAYWSLPRDAKPDVVEPRELRAALLDSVRLRLMSDVPLGVFLSGGVDSAAVLGLMREAGADSVASFTIGFDDAVFDERPQARVTSERFGSDHHEVVVGADHFVDALPRLAWYRDEPIAEPAEIPLLLLSEFAGRQVKVVLSGEGGDELFGGYPKYRAERLLGLPTAVPRLALRIAGEVAVRRRSHRQLQRALETLEIRDPLLRWASWFRAFSADDLERVLAPRLRASVEPERLISPLAARLAPFEHLDAPRRMLVGDLQSYLPDNMLLRGDRVLMAGSIEGRMPLLDYRVIERVVRAPVSQRAAWLRSKKVLRQAVADLIPDDVQRAPKRGFPVPVARFLLEGRAQLADRLVLSDRALDRGLFDRGALVSLVEEARASRFDSQLRLFTLVSLELWQRANIDELTTQPPTTLAELLEPSEECEPHDAVA